MATPGSTPRTTVHRLPERAVTDTGTLRAILDAGLVAHIGIADDSGQPFVIPVAYARRGEEIVFHGSRASRLMRALAAGAPACLTVTLLDGIVLARSAFNSTMNYRCVIVLGQARELSGDDELDALRTVTEHLLPGQWAHIRHPSEQERKATITFCLPLAECSVKVRDGGPDDDDDDVRDLAQVWAGVIPVRESFGPPEPSDDTPPHLPVPAHLLSWTR